MQLDIQSKSNFGNGTTFGGRSSFLKVAKKEDRELNQRIAQKGLGDILLPVEKWIEEREAINYKKIIKPLNSSELMRYVSNSVAKGKPFSNSVIDKVIQLNEFCFYCPKHASTKLCTFSARL